MRLTASRLHLADRCPASCALPTAADWADSDTAAAGTGRHAYLSALAATGSREAALATVPDGAPWRAPCEAIDTEALLAGVARIEHDLAHSYDPERDTASPIVVDAHRAYELDDTQIPGTLDWLVTRLDGSVEVVDFKGEMPVTPAASNLQLALYALQAARSRGLDEVGVAICYVRADGTLRWDRALLDVFALACAAARIRDVWGRVTAARALRAGGGDPSVRVGDHCTYCPALRRCPAHVALARELVAQGERPVDDVTRELASLSDAQAGEAYERLERLQAILDACRASLRVRVMRGDLPLPDGRVLRAVESAPRSLVVSKALPVLRSRVGDRADALVRQSLDAGVVGQLVRELHPGKGQRKHEEALWAELEAAGAVKTGSVTSLRRVAT